MNQLPYSFEVISPRHRDAVIGIFNWFVLNSFAAYPEEPVGSDFFDRLMEMAKGYPWLVAKDHAGHVVGFAFLRPYHPAGTFRRTAEITYFILPEHSRKGLGSAILDRLLIDARNRGIDTILANISSKNAPSLRFHLKNGFHECGNFPAIGNKFGEDFGVVWMLLRI